MIKFFFILVILCCYSCSPDKLNDCIGNVGQIVNHEIFLDNFSKLNVSKGIEVEIFQSKEHKICIEVGENMKKYMEYVVNNDELTLKNNLSCTLGYTKPVKIKVYTPNLSNIVSSSQYDIYSNETLRFSTLHIKHGLEKEDVASKLKLDIISNELTIETNSLIFYDLKGETNSLKVYFWGGSPRIEAYDLIAQNIFILQRSTNYMFLNAVQSIEGEIYSNANVYLISKPKHINVVSLNKGVIVIK